jgi:hypothetical protein
VLKESPTKRKRGSLAEDEIYEIQLKVAIAVTMNYTNGPTKILLQFLLTLLCKYYANGRRLVYIAGTHDSLISVFVYNGKETHECITDVFCLCSSCFHPLLIVDCSSTGEDHQQIQDQLFGQLAFVHGLYGLLVRESTLMLYHVDQMTFAASGWIHVGDQVAVKQLFSMLADIMKVCPNCGS